MPSSRTNLKQILRLAAAPMAGISTPAFRVLCRGMGATMGFTEMVSAKGLLLGNRKTRHFLDLFPEERPAGAQI